VNAELRSYLNDPIPRKVALAVTIAQGIACTYAAGRALQKQAKQANAIIADQTERLHIYNEAIQVLLPEAHPETLAKLDGNLAFWAIIRGSSAQSPKPPSD
jgi:hypothetical protein